MLMSHSFQARNVYVQYTFAFSKKRLTPVRPFWIRANGCVTTQPSYSVQTLSSGLDHRTFHWTVPMNGRIVAAGGHLHGGAEHMSLTQPGCRDRKLLDTDPLFGAAHRPRLPDQPDPARAGPRRHPLLPVEDRHPGAQGREDRPAGRLQRRATRAPA